MCNLNVLDIPMDADGATDYALRREFGLRYDSYREAQVREIGLREAFACLNPEDIWIVEQERIHSIRAELL